MVYLQQHSLRYNPEHPPLGKLIIASGLAFADAHLDPGFTGDQTALGRHVLYESGNDPWRLMLFARLPVIVLTLLFGLVVFAFARDLAGAGGRVGGARAVRVLARRHRARIAGHARRTGGRFPADLGVAALAGAAAAASATSRSPGWRSARPWPRG